MNWAAEFPVTYCISEGSLSGSDPDDHRAAIIERVRIASRCGIDLFQVREKGLDTDVLFQLSKEAVKAARDTKLKVLVNDRVDVALSAGAAGVHLPSNGLPVSAVRSSTPAGFVIGVSTHSLDDVIAASSDGADFAVFGPVFPSPGKPTHTGLDMLKEVCSAAAPFPILALGGIDESNFQMALDAGAFGYASIRYLNAVVDGRVRLEKMGPI